MQTESLPKITLLAAIFTLALLLIPRFSPLQMPFTEDLGMSFAVAASASEGQLPLLGPPSHQGGRHLGPLYYYMLAVPYALSGGNVLATMFSQTVLKFFAVALLALLSFRILPDRVKWWGPAAIAVFLLTVRNRELLADSWHPHCLLVTSPIFVWTLRWTLEKGTEKLGAFLVGASLLLQSHFSAVPLVVACSGVLAVRIVVARKTPGFVRRPTLRQLIGAVFCLGLLWLGPLLYEFQYGSNLRALFFSHAPSQGSAAGILSAAKSIMLFFQQMFLFGAAGTPTEPFWAVALPFVLLAATILFRNRHLLSVHDRWLAGATIAGVAIYLPALARLHAALYQYFLLPLWGPVLLLGAVTFALGMATSFSRGLTIALALIGIVSASLNYSRVFPFHSLMHADEVTRLIRTDAGDQPFRIEVSSASKFMHGPFAFFAGRDNFELIKGWDKLKEFHRSPVRMSKFKRVYGVMCPQLSRLERRWFNERFRSGWVKEKELDASSCETCDRCYLPSFARAKRS